MSTMDLSDFKLIEIKSLGISAVNVDEMKSLSGTYESLFSRSAMKYKALGLKDKQISEEEYRQFIIDEYTFLKRPVFIIGKEIFIGNSKNIIEQVHLKIGKK